jgi:hypothetical protein
VASQAKARAGALKSPRLRSSWRSHYRPFFTATSVAAKPVVRNDASNDFAGLIAFSFIQVMGETV